MFICLTLSSLGGNIQWYIHVKGDRKNTENGGSKEYEGTIKLANSKISLYLSSNDGVRRYFSVVTEIL